MELNLSLGGKPKSYKYLDKAEKTSKEDIGFFRDLGKAKEGDQSRKEDQPITSFIRFNYEDDQKRYAVGSNPPVQLDLLPYSPVQSNNISSHIFYRSLSENVSGPLGMEVSMCKNRKSISKRSDFEAVIDLDEEEEGSTGARKKLRLTKDESAFLEESFKQHKTLNPKQKASLAKRLNLRPRQVEVWFQNRRARTKLKQTEIDRECLRRCCEALTEENMKLQNELQQLRASIKTATSQLPSATTLTTYCLSCQHRVFTPTSSTDHRLSLA